MFFTVFALVAGKHIALVASERVNIPKQCDCLSAKRDYVRVLHLHFVGGNAATLPRQGQIHPIQPPKGWPVWQISRVEAVARFLQQNYRHKHQCLLTVAPMA